MMMGAPTIPYDEKYVCSKCGSDNVSVLMPTWVSLYRYHSNIEVEWEAMHLSAWCEVCDHPTELIEGRLAQSGGE